MMAAVDAMTLARYVVSESSKAGEPVSNLQLQKIMYFLQCTYCRRTKGNLLFNDEFEAWPYGPVLCQVYEGYSRFGGRTIDEQYDGAESRLGVDKATKDFIDVGMTVLRQKYPWDLVKHSHAPGMPWDNVYKDGAGYKRPIPNSMIVETYGG